jgi:hypothetical protein
MRDASQVRVPVFVIVSGTVISREAVSVRGLRPSMENAS